MLRIALTHIRGLADNLVAYDYYLDPQAKPKGKIPALWRTITGRNGAVEFEMRAGLLQIRAGMFDRRLKRASPTKAMLDEIFALSEIEPQVLAAGISAIGKLPVHKMDQNVKLWGLNSYLLKLVLETRPDVVVVAPWYSRHGGGEKYTRDLVEVLSQFGQSVLVVTTEDGVTESTELQPFRSNQAESAQVSTLIWSDLYPGNPDDAMALTEVVNRLSPKRLIVVNSHIGLEALRVDAEPLKNRVQEFAIFFSMDTSRVASQYGVVYAKHLRPGVKILSDNEKSLRSLSAMNPAKELTDFHLLRTRILEAPLEEFDKNLAKPLALQDQTFASEWLWVSRVSAQKGTGVLRNLAELRPRDTFHVFGSRGSESLKELGLDQKNIIVHGEFESLEALDPGQYRGLIFTSKFEGQPLTVLELATYGIPIFSTNVGDLESLFGDQCIRFVENHSNDMDTAKAFDASIATFFEEDARSVCNRLVEMREKVISKHSTTAHKKAIWEVFVDEKA